MNNIPACGNRGLSTCTLVKKWSLTLLLIVAAAFLHGNAVAGTMTAATGGSAISADTTSAAGGSGAWTSLSGPTYIESIVGDLIVGSVILTAPAGFEFNTAATVTVRLDSGNNNPNQNINNTAVGGTIATATVTATTISWNITSKSNGQTLDQFTWLGIQVRPTAGTPLASANLIPSGTSSIGTYAASAGTLTEVAGAAKKLVFVQQPSSVVASCAALSTSIAPAPTVQIQDQFGNNSTTATNSITMAIGANPSGGTLSGTNPVSAVAGLATFSNVKIDTVGTGYTLVASGTGLTSATSTPFNVTFGVLNNFLVEASGGGNIATQTQNIAFPIQVIARDVCNNTVTNFTGTVAITSSCTLAAGGGITAAFTAGVLNPRSLTISSIGSCTITATNTAAPVVAGISNTFTVTTAVSSFNAIEPGANAVSGKIFTKIAGQNFALDIVALDASNAISTGFNGAVAVDVVDNTSGSGVCANMTVISALTNQIFVAGDAGRHILSSPNTVSDVWRNARVRIKYPVGAPTVISCSGDNFAIRPASFAGMSVTDSDWQTAGNTRALNNTSATGPGCSAVNTPIGCAGAIHKAGQPFTLQATAVNAVAATTTNYTGTPSALLSACAGTACTATFGAFAMGTGTAVAGVIDSTTATYSEVGAFALQLQDQTFASVDAADGTTADCAGQYVCSATLNVGRFVPDHFDTVVKYDTVSKVFMSCPSGLTCPASGDLVYGNGFVYSGQPFTAQVTARNAAGAATLNYDSAKSLSKAVKLSAWDAAGGAIANPPGGNGNLTLNTVPSTAFSAGVATTTNTPIYTFTTIPTAPADIFMRAVDADNVSSLRTIASNSVEGGIKVVSGRIKVSNAYGSELLPLTLTATAQFYNATGSWVTSATDSATTFNTNKTPGGNLVPVIVKGPLALGNISVVGAGVVTVASGVKVFNLTKPNVTGSADITLNAPTYLPGVAGRATFGVYKGSNNIIYLRENY